VVIGELEAFTYIPQRSRFSSDALSYRATGRTNEWERISSPDAPASLFNADSVLALRFQDLGADVVDAPFWMRRSFSVPASTLR
jgi:hypothetical protein